MNWRFWTAKKGSDADTCADIEPLLSLDVDGMAAPEERRRIHSHLLDCEACRKAQRWIAATQTVLGARPLVAPPANMRARIAQALAAAPAIPVARQPVRRPLLLRPATALAFSVVLAGAFVGHAYLTGTSSHPAGPQPPTVIAVLPPPTAPLVPSTVPFVTALPSTHRHPIATIKPPVKHNDKIAFVPTETAPTEITPPAVIEHKPAPDNIVARLVKPAPRPAIHPQPTPEKIAAKPSPKPRRPLLASANVHSTPDFSKPPTHELAPKTAHPAPAPQTETHVAALLPAPTHEPARETVTPEPSHHDVQVASAPDDLLGSVRRTVGQMRRAPVSRQFGTVVRGTLHSAAFEAGSGKTTAVASVVYSDINR